MQTLQKEMNRAVLRVIDRQTAVGAALYDRNRHLRRLLPLAHDDIQSDDPQARRRILLLLAKALRTQRRLGRAGHWTYDLNRHLALAQAFRAEKAMDR